MNSKKLKQVLENNSDKKILINAVISRIGLDSVEDVTNHGIDGGFGGFIYYSDTVKFYRRYRKMINKMVFEMAEELGEGGVELVGGFNCLKYYDARKEKWTDTEGRDEIGRCIYGGRLNGNTQQVENALAWFAAEEVCRMFDNDDE